MSNATRALLLLLAVLAGPAVASGCGATPDSRERSEGRRTATTDSPERTPSPTRGARSIGAPAPASGRVAFSAGTYPHTDVYVVSADGSALNRLTRGPEAEFDPSWSPDGKRIAFRYQRGGDETADVYVMKADGSGRENLTRDSAMDYSPAWSPDGTQIAFASSRSGRLPTIWIMNDDGSHPRRVAEVDGEYPAWSPDGHKIAFDHQTFGATGWDVWVMNIDGSGARPLVKTRADDQGPDWSPDGRSIAFGSGLNAEPGYDHVWTIGADGSHPRRVTQRYGDRPVWSPDGRHILFQADGLYIVRRDRSRLSQIPIHGVGETTLPDWTG